MTTNNSMIPPSEVRALADRISNLEHELSSLKRSSRRTQLGYSSLQNSHINLYLGDEVRARIGQQSDGQAAVVYMGGSPPPQPEQPTLSARQLAFVVGWDGTFEGAAPKPSNFQRIDIHVSETLGFTPTGDTAWASLFDKGAIAIPGDVDEKFVKLVAVSNSQVPSEPSLESSITPLPADYIAAQSIGAEELATDILLTSLIRMQNTSGVETLRFDGSTGDATIAGEYKTAETGERIVINSNQTDAKTIRFYPETGTAHAAIYRTGENFVIKSEDDASGNSGKFFTTNSAAAISSGSEGGAQLSQVDAAPTYLLFKGGTAPSWFMKPGFDNWPALVSNQNNCGIVSGVRWNGVENDACVYATYANGANHADITCRTLRQSSSQDSKRNIESIPFAALAAIRNAPSLMWERPDPPLPPDTPPPVRGPGGPYDTVPPSRGDEVSDKPPPMSSRGVKHFGPRAGDLPTEMVSIDGMSGGLVIDLGSQIGIVWKAVEEIGERLDTIEARL